MFSLVQLIGCEPLHPQLLAIRRAVDDPKRARVLGGPAAVVDPMPAEPLRELHPRREDAVVPDDPRCADMRGDRLDRAQLLDHQPPRDADGHDSGQQREALRQPAGQ